MEITSPVFENNDKIASKYTCDGENINPPLIFSNVPPETKSLALIVDDPDAIPFAGHIFVHWLVWNIDPNICKILENSVPKNSVQGITSYQKPGWGGPCPPAGDHHYYFKLYALDTMLNLSFNSQKKDLENAMQGHILASAELIGRYKRG